MKWTTKIFKVLVVAKGLKNNLYILFWLQDVKELLSTKLVYHASYQDVQRNDYICAQLQIIQIRKPRFFFFLLY